MRTGARALLAATLVLLAPPAAARADDVICLQDPSCPGGAQQANTVAEAEAFAELGTDYDVVRIGPGTFAMPDTFTAVEPITIIGAGRGRTVLNYTGLGDGMSLSGSAQTSVRAFTVRLASSAGQDAFRLADGADAFDVGVTSVSLDSATNGGILVEDLGTVIHGVDVRLATDQPFSSAVHNFEGSRIEDSYIQGGIGISPGDTKTEIRRTIIRATDPIRVFGGIAEASNVILTPHPQENHAFWVGLSSNNNGNEAGSPGEVTASNLTIDGRGVPNSTGIEVRGVVEASNTLAPAKATIEGAVIRNVTRALSRQGPSASFPATLIIRASSYDGTKVSNIPGFGSLSAGPSNLTGNLDPRFIDPANLDYRLRFDSPLIDKGDLTPLVPDQDPDVDGNPRVRDGNGNGGSVVDIGAQEYQRLAPRAAFTASGALLGEPTLFNAAGSSDPDGEGIASYAWSFAGGGTATGASAAHVFGAPGSFAATLTVRDPSGLSASVTRSSAVAGRPGRCANERSGGTGPDVITGFDSGDRLLGGRGNDRLLGMLGDDCLDGGRGNDRLDGGAGKDRVNGGRGRDRVAGAAGDDRLTAGPGGGRLTGGGGNDRIGAANGARDRVDCGRGRRDRATVDAVDRVRGCERVKRRRKRR